MCSFASQCTFVETTKLCKCGLAHAEEQQLVHSTRPPPLEAPVVFTGWLGVHTWQYLFILAWTSPSCPPPPFPCRPCCYGGGSWHPYFQPPSSFPQFETYINSTCCVFDFFMCGSRAGVLDKDGAIFLFKLGRQLFWCLGLRCCQK